MTLPPSTSSGRRLTFTSLLPERFLELWAVQYLVEPFWAKDREVHRFGAWIPDWNQACLWAKKKSCDLRIEMAVIQYGDLLATFDTE
jgi:hypothetical protein